MSDRGQDPPPTRVERGRDGVAGGAGEAPEGGTALAAGARVGAFEILGLLGRGGMGEVYEAFDHELRRKVALKLIAPETSRDPAFVARFRREAQLAGTVSHPNVAQVFAAGEHEGRPYYVMEHVEGESLAIRLAAGERLGGRAGLEYLLQACRGLQAAWEAGVVHRDVKPSNLILTAAGTLKIVDFGLARSLAVDGRSGLTEPDLIVGTPTYTAPEQALGLEVDHRADIYSLGATFYHLFSGAPVFAAESALGVLVRHVEETPRPLAAVRAAIPPAVSDLVDRMLAKAPEDRWQTYAELIAELERIRAGGTGPAPARSPASWYRMPVVWVTAALAVALVLVLVLERDVPAVPATGDGGTAEATAGPRRPEGLESAALGPAEPTAQTLLAPSEIERFLEQAGAHPLVTAAWGAQTLATLRRLATTVEMHQAEEGVFPESLEALRERYGLARRDLLDAWQTPVRLTTAGDAYTLRSAGPDRQPGNADDLVIEDGYVLQGGPPPPP